MGQPVGGHGIGTGYGVPARRRPGGEDGGEQLVGKAEAVRQLVDPLRLSGDGVPEENTALVGDSRQEPVGDLPGLAAVFSDLPADDARRPAAEPLDDGIDEEQLPAVPAELAGGLQTAVGPGVAGFVFGGGVHDVLPQGGEARPVVAAAEVHIALNDSGVLRFHHVGSGPVHQRDAPLGQDQAVQRLRVAGAGDEHRFQPGGLGVAGHPPHEGGLAAAGPSF